MLVDRLADRCDTLAQVVILSVIIARSCAVKPKHTWCSGNPHIQTDESDCASCHIYPPSGRVWNMGGSKPTGMGHNKMKIKSTNMSLEVPGTPYGVHDHAGSCRLWAMIGPNDPRARRYGTSSLSWSVSWWGNYRQPWQCPRTAWNMLGPKLATTLLCTRLTSTSKASGLGLGKTEPPQTIMTWGLCPELPCAKTSLSSV